MLFFLTPQHPSPVYYDPEETFLGYQRLEYTSALQEQQQRIAFERELAIEEERHRRALASLAQQEAARRRLQPLVRIAQAVPESPRCFSRQPAPEEILARRYAREHEEKRHSRQSRDQILRQILGVVSEEAMEAISPMQQGQHTSPQDPSLSATSKPVDKGKQPAVKRPRSEEPEPHWSAAPERARSLAEIASINRTFSSLKNTFAFPSGPLEALPNSDLPRLAYNATNASIHAFEHALAELLTQLDGIESHGFKGVREARKQLVVEINKELEELEKKISERLAQNASPASAPVPVPDVVVPVEEVQHKETEDIAMADKPIGNAATVHGVPNIAGYDIDFEEAPVVAVKSMAEPAEGVSALSQDMEVEPVNIPVPSESKADTRPSSPLSTPPANNATQLSAAPEAIDSSAPTAGTVPPTISLEEYTSDEEESEIEDAVHVIIEDKEAIAHDQQAATTVSNQEVEYELV